MTISERVAYLKGLAEGLNLGSDTKEAKLFNAIIDVLEDIALELEEDADRLDVLDEDLANVEDIVYDLEDEWDDAWDEEEDEDDGVYEFECPNCHETVFFDESIFEDDEDFELECPACGAKLDLDSLFEEEEGEGDDELEF
ncbi:MAG: hypothetical protein IK104_06440 [Clostridia bacterium]|nr:hypothetical protein [Clostridia bacterium]